MAENQSSYRLFGSLRFLLAVMVVVSHSALLGGPEILAIIRPWGLGNIAVMVFFCLSGYIIAEALDAFYVRRIGGFLANRALRIIPPYIAALAVSITLHLWLASLGQLSLFDYETMPDGIFSEKNYLSNVLLIVARVQIRSATLINGLGGRDAIASEPLDRQVKVAWNELHTPHPRRTIPNCHPSQSRT